MTVINPRTNSTAGGRSSRFVPVAPLAHPPNVEALPGLGWSQAVELPRVATLATKPVEARRAWIHLASQEQVLALYRASRAGRRAPASPWWLRAITAGTLASREAGFDIEDRVAELLTGRSGWVYVPWANDGESGYWEFAPSERPAAGIPNPTTLLHTDRHTGWIDVVPAHGDVAPEPIAVADVADLRARIGEFEAVR